MADAQMCGHPASLLLMSAETGEPLYCELCDMYRQRNDAVAVEAELRKEIAALCAHLSTAPQPQAGWKLVPDTATHNMLNAANAGRKKGRSSSGEIYRAMLAAAPTKGTP